MSFSGIERLNCSSFIRDRVERGCTHRAIATELQGMYPGTIGLSARSVRRYCSRNNIHYSSCLNDGQLRDLVEQAVSRVCRLYSCSIILCS